MSLFLRLAPYLLLSILSTFSLWRMFLGDGLPVGHDLPLEMVRLSEFKDALITQILPRYAPHTYGGLGSPVFTFYAPLFTFGSSLLAILTGSLSQGVILWFTFLKISSVLAVYQASVPLKKSRAFLLAVVWCFLPYGFIDLYTRNAFAEGTALYLIPIVGLSISFLWNAKKITWRHFLLCTVLVSMFLLSHNLTIVLCAFFVFCGATMYSLWQLLWKSAYFFEQLRHKKQHIATLLTSTLVAFGLTSWFLLPVLFEKNTVHLEELTKGKFAFEENFSSLGDMLLNVQSIAFVGPITALLLVVGLGIVLLKVLRKTCKASDGLLCSGVLLTGFSLFVMLPSSRFLWELLPFFPMIQFPWRFQLFISLGTILLLAGLWKSLPKQHFLACILGCLLLVQSVCFSMWNDSLSQLQYSNFDGLTGAQIAAENLHSTVGDEYVPQSFDLENFPISGTPFFQAQYYTTETRLFSTVYTSCRLGRNSLESTTLLAYPLLTVESDGQVLEPVDGSYIIPASRNCIRVTLHYSVMQQLGMILCILSLLALVTISLLFYRRRVR